MLQRWQFLRVTFTWIFLLIYFYFLLYSFLIVLSLFYCCSSTVISISHHRVPPSTHPDLPPSSLPSLCSCPWVLYTCSLTTLPLHCCVIPHPPPLWLLSIIYFNVSSYNFACLFILLIRFHLQCSSWLISLSIMLSSSIHAVTKGRSSFFLSAV